MSENAPSATPPHVERPDMADYGVPEEIDGALDWSWAEQRLATTRNFWLVTVNGAGRPHSMPVWGIWLPDRQRFGFSCAPSARKVRNIAANDRVVFTTDNSVEAISVEGRAIPLAANDRDHAAAAWAQKYHDGSQTEDEMAAFFAGGAAYEVIPERAFGIIETAEEFGPAATRWVWR